VVASAAESEVGACFQNAQTADPIRVTLLQLGHNQPATPLRTDKSTAYGILNETIKQKRSKSMDMKYYWLAGKLPEKSSDDNYKHNERSNHNSGGGHSGGRLGNNQANKGGESTAEHLRGYFFSRERGQELVWKARFPWHLQRLQRCCS
jgi:hypothetical protein